MTLAEFKFIWTMEYLHRMWGRGIGKNFSSWEGLQRQGSLDGPLPFFKQYSFLLDEDRIGTYFAERIKRMCFQVLSFWFRALTSGRKEPSIDKWRFEWAWRAFWFVHRLGIDCCCYKLSCTPGPHWLVDGEVRIGPPAKFRFRDPTCQSISSGCTPRNGIHSLHSLLVVWSVTCLHPLWCTCSLHLLLSLFNRPLI